MSHQAYEASESVSLDLWKLYGLYINLTHWRDLRISNSMIRFKNNPGQKWIRQSLLQIRTKGVPRGSFLKIQNNPKMPVWKRGEARPPNNRQSHTHAEDNLRCNLINRNRFVGLTCFQSTLNQDHQLPSGVVFRRGWHASYTKSHGHEWMMLDPCFNAIINALCCLRRPFVCLRWAPVLVLAVFAHVTMCTVEHLYKI